MNTKNLQRITLTFLCVQTYVENVALTVGLAAIILAKGLTPIIIYNIYIYILGYLLAIELEFISAILKYPSKK